MVPEHDMLHNKNSKAMKEALEMDKSVQFKTFIHENKNDVK